MEDPNEFARKVFAAVDFRDFSQLRPYMTDDCEFTFANQPIVKGIEAFEQAANAFSCRLASISHDIHTVIASGDDMAFRLTVHYRRADGFELSCPAASIFRLRDGKIARYDVYVDNTALFA